MNHTPGPWKALEVIARGGSMGWRVTDEKGKISVVGWNLESLLSEGNARLIAAAPEFKEALIDIADAANDLWALFSHNPDEIPYGEEYDNETMRLHRIIGEKLREHGEAIRKAKGES